MDGDEWLGNVKPIDTGFSMNPVTFRRMATDVRDGPRPIRRGAAANRSLLALAQGVPPGCNDTGGIDGILDRRGRLPESTLLVDEPLHRADV